MDDALALTSTHCSLLYSLCSTSTPYSAGSFCYKKLYGKSLATWQKILIFFPEVKTGRQAPATQAWVINVIPKDTAYQTENDQGISIFLLPGCGPQKLLITTNAWYWTDGRFGLSDLKALVDVWWNWYVSSVLPRVEINLKPSLHEGRENCILLVCGDFKAGVSISRC